ncbi:hemagglutinin [Nocardioides marmoriginsengisoli]|uniref:Hemagglutinin n=1 Tax=Nocardioides marmoriginsengisoli TaxID=661483 RepID=A0A3N0CN86_9ACTN|nr:hemagglutinin [Nocardioides marmoriginsengisoli]RNL64895.1 hemagglutinin [Nocardioides marmoriginsengisoli]
MTAAVLLAMAGALVPLSPAAAADGPFTIDATVPDVSPAPAELGDQFGNVKELGPKNASSTKISVIHKAAVPMLDATNPNAQVDLRRAWLATARDSGTNHDWLYFGWERDSNSGSGFIAYEFMKKAAPAACDYANATDAQLTASCNPWKNREAGDFMILWDQSGSSTTLYLREWSGVAPNLTLGPPAALSAAVSQAAFSADKFRGEAAVDLTATIFGGSTACKSFANTIPSTVTGNSDTADYKDTILKQAPPITNCTSTTVTTPKQAGGAGIPLGGLSIGTGVVGVKDEAVVSLNGGSGTPAGSVEFSLCKVDAPDLCTGGTTVGSTSLSGGSYPATVTSPVAYVTSVGRYCWRAVFSGDSAAGIPGSSENSSLECFTVNPVTATLSTSAGADQLVGGTLTDSAALGGTATQPANPVINLTGTAGAAAGGTITFKLYGPSSVGCGSLVHTSAAVPVSGNGGYNTPAPQFEPSAPGDYHWVATYSGSSPNTTGLTHNADCSDTAEDVTVSTVNSSMTTEQTWVPNDSATISAPAGGALAGTVSFVLYPSTDCTGTPLYSTTEAVAGNSAQTVGTDNDDAVSVSGDFSWLVGYDSTNPAQEDIAPSCHETSALTIENGGTISSP